MLTLELLRKLEFPTRPPVQRVAANLVHLNYRLSGVQVEVEGEENIPVDEPVIYAMNHTDRFNYMPFQVFLHRSGRHRYVATWVKGKYYEHPVVAWALNATVNLPVPARAYLYIKDFQQVFKRMPTEREFEVLRGWRDAPEQAIRVVEGLPHLETLWTTSRNVLGKDFFPFEQAYPDFMESLFNDMMQAFVTLNEHALKVQKLNVQIFPQGTRSIRLSRGHTGLAQVAMKTGVSIVPVGCNGSDRIYPGDSPWARAGRVVYRIGRPLRWDGELAPLRLHTPFAPFHRTDERLHRQRFQDVVDLVMDRINGLVDPEYQYAADRESDGVKGVDRFL
jgi:1-acyl-sn-glycerol-3-phosphate acyltransferase